MIDQTIPFPALVAGMARCVREWLLPHLTDPMARAQAELLATLLDGLPAAYAPGVGQAIAADSAAAVALLETFGERTPPVHAAAPVDDLMRENAALKARLQALADAKRALADDDAVAALRRFFLASMAGEVRLAAAEGTDFASISAKEGAGKRREDT
jgi:hypothetical protein